MYIYTSFRNWGDVGSPPSSEKFAHCPSPHRKSIEPNNKIKSSFLAVVIAPVPFLF